MKHGLNMGFAIRKSSIMSGAGSALGIGGNYFRFDKSSSHVLSDANALQSDWKAVGKDISSSMNKSKTTVVHGRATAG